MPHTDPRSRHTFGPGGRTQELSYQAHADGDHSFRNPAQIVGRAATGRGKRTHRPAKFEFTALPELWLGGAETIRVTKTGVVDIAEVYLGYVGGELPLVERLEIPDVVPDQEAMESAFQAWRPHLAKFIDEKVNSVLVATAFQTDQLRFSSGGIERGLRTTSAKAWSSYRSPLTFRIL
jgi:hypothetical protein